MKKSFLVYFDNCRQLECLPDEAYAAVWRTVAEYARRLAEGDEAEKWLAQRLAALPAEVSMAARFMTDNVRRDDSTYRTRTAQYRAHGEALRAGKSDCFGSRPQGESWQDSRNSAVMKYLRERTLGERQD